MSAKILIGVAIGASLGALLGSTRTCETGSCPLTANPKRGALWGGLLGLLVVWAMYSTRPVPSTLPAKGTAASLGPVVSLTSVDEFNRQVLSRTGKSLVYFHAGWCAVCKSYTPIYETVAARFTPQVSFFEVDIDRVPELARSYDIEAIPTTLIFEHGKSTSQYVGFVTERILARAVSSSTARNAGRD